MIHVLFRHINWFTLWWLSLLVLPWCGSWEHTICTHGNNFCCYIHSNTWLVYMITKNFSFYSFLWTKCWWYQKINDCWFSIIIYSFDVVQVLITFYWFWTNDNHILCRTPQSCFSILFSHTIFNCFFIHDSAAEGIQSRSEVFSLGSILIFILC